MTANYGKKYVTKNINAQMKITIYFIRAQIRRRIDLRLVILETPYSIRKTTHKKTNFRI